MDKIIIRKAAQGEASQIAELFLLAWPVDEIASSNGITYKELHETVTAIAASKETIYSFENTFVAAIDDKIVGAICGYDGADYLKLKRPILDLLGHDSEFARMTETEAGEFYIDSIGVLPEYRGRGIASQMFVALIERARSLGHRKVGLIVDIDKPETEALYLRLGFRHVGYKDFFGHKMKHMVRIIE